MNLHYITGVAFGIIGGILTQFGQLLEKKAVNQYRKDSQEYGFFRRLVKSPVWVSGVIFGLGGGTAAYMVAQSLIGPALTPGLMASGLIVLAIGSVRMNQESLNPSEILGIGLMIIGILFLGLSGLAINSTQVRSTLANHYALQRIATFTVCFFLFSFITRSLACRTKHRKGMFISLANGFLACLYDFWINPLLALTAIVSGGNGSFSQSVIFHFFCLHPDRMCFRHYMAESIGLQGCTSKQRSPGRTGTDPNLSHIGLLLHFRLYSTKPHLHDLYSHWYHPDHHCRFPVWAKTGNPNHLGDQPCIAS
jgi:drug/metabolite transporter (DMT)-like permease